MAKQIPRLSPDQIKSIIKTAFADRPPYQRVFVEHGLGQGELVALMKRELTPTAYKTWATQAKATKPATVKSTFPHGR